MKKTKILLLVFIVCKVLHIAADPAPRTLILLPQPDGDSLWIHERGDEFYHWEESTDGYVIVQKLQENQ